jgi:antitoxin HicB
MLGEGMSNVALARQLGTDEKTVRRLRDPLHQSRIARIDAALRVLGKRIGIVVEAA